MKAIIITAIICLTLVALTYISNSKGGDEE